ncbi:MAG: asparagine--tRNA ligase [Planctomycetes bacterium]|nr:asparagine--tRNA ligase [Planctomycetota bacterium]MCB9909238.1 asparagine--tRNA ligase [Planctomycetota bacterium]HPF15682.1 asparagine--tRNA ligase [Planctomycetota bacterium]
MTVTTIERLADHIGETVTLRGWVHNRTSKGKLHFVMLRDGTGYVQCVLVKGGVGEELFEQVSRAGQESSLELTGHVEADERAPGGFEIKVSDGRVYQLVEEYPITPKEHGPDFLLSRRHLWLRSKRQWAILRIRDAVITSIRHFFDERGFVCIDSPMFTPSACEGTSTLFEVDYFGEDKAYLTQSGQLYAEASAMAFGKVFCFGPTFRAEKSKTRRHLTEFWMLEPEVAFATLEDIMQLAEDLIVRIVGDVLQRRRRELEALERDLSLLERIQGGFARITYDEASKILLEHPGSEFVAGDDFGAPDESILSGLHDQPVLITHYPKDIKSFYMKEDPANPSRVLCMDMIAPEGVGEIIGGSQREEDLDTLLASIAKHKLPKEDFEWYLDLRRFGSVPHSGFGLGLERVVGWIAGIEHVREAAPFPRLMSRIRP